MKKIILFVLCAVAFTGCNKEKVNAITLQEAQQTALKEVDGRVLKAAEEKDDNLVYYEFTIVTETEMYEVEVNAENGEVIKTEKDDDYAGTTTIPNGDVLPIDKTQTKLTLEEAQKIALDRVKEGHIRKSELDIENDLTVYEIEIENGNQEYDVTINANSGEIVKYEEDKND